MLSYLNLKRGTQFLLENQPHEVIDSHPMRKAQDVTVIQITAKNLLTGNVIERSFHKDDKFEEANMEKIEIKFLYSHPDRKSSISNGASRKKFGFCEAKNPAERFELSEEQIGEKSKFLKQNQSLTGIKFQEKIISIILPIKVQLKVIEAPPGVKGERAQAGTKAVTLETGAQVNVPLFIEQDDIIEVNTETSEYVRRVE